MKPIKLNMNSYVKVKLTEHGEEIFKESEMSLVKFFQDKGIKHTPHHKTPDEDGYYKFQMWNFMNIFGSHLTLGSNVCDCSFIMEVDETQL